MLGIQHFEVFLVSGILLNLTPGSDTIYILSRSIAQGKQAGISSVLGISSGIIVHTLLAALGLSMILAQSATAFLVVKMLGAAYLLYLGWSTLRSKEAVFTLAETAETAHWKLYWQGLLTNVLNPKVALFFLAFLPQFIDTDSSYGILPFLLLGLTFFATGTLWCLLLVAASAQVTAFLRQSRKAGAMMNKACGILYLGLGIKLLLAEQK